MGECLPNGRQCSWAFTLFQADTLKKAGRVVQTTRIIVSDDGRTMRVIQERDATNVLVFETQDGRPRGWLTSARPQFLRISRYTLSLIPVPLPPLRIFRTDKRSSMLAAH